MRFINIFGISTVALMLIPNIIWALKNKDAQNKCSNKLLNALEQVGRYGSMLSMSLNVGVFEVGFRSNDGFALWLLATAALLLAYYVCWALLFRSKQTQLPLAIIPSAIFLFSGIMSTSAPLTAFALLFSVTHIWITKINISQSA